MAFKGYGVARIDGKVVFIPYSVIGDEAWIEMIEEKKDYSIGKLNEVSSNHPLGEQILSVPTLVCVAAVSGNTSTIQFMGN